MKDALLKLLTYYICYSYYELNNLMPFDCTLFGFCLSRNDQMNTRLASNSEYVT